MRRSLSSLLAVLLLAGCSSGSSDDDETELTVFAASSLTAAFTERIGPAFEAGRDGVTVTFNFAASDTLAEQIQSEGTADVFASASATWMDAVQDDPGVTGRVDFATNRLVIVTPADNPAGIASIEDLADDGVQLVLAAEGVPVGDYAREALDKAGIADEAEANVVSNEEDNASVVAKIAARRRRCRHRVRVRHLGSGRQRCRRSGDTRRRERRRDLPGRGDRWGHG